MIQGDESWLAARIAKITASEIGGILGRKADKTALCIIENGNLVEKIGNGVAAEKKAAQARAAGKTVEEIVYERGGRTDGFYSYRDRMVCELLTGESAVGDYQNFAMKRGQDLEPYAKATFEARFGVVIQDAGFIVHPRLSYVGASPDGLLPDRGVEVKSPLSPIVHLHTILNGMSQDHMPQLQCGMWCTGLEFWEFISYNPTFPDDLRLYTQTISVDHQMQREMHLACTELWSSANELVERVRSKGQK